MARPRVPSLGYLVWHLSIKWRVAVDRALNPFGLTHAHYSLLASLYALSRDGTRPSQRELADFAGLEVMYVSKLARALECSGLLRRTDHPGDPRAFQLVLTVKGADVIVDAAAVVRELDEQLLRPLRGYTSKQTAALMQTLDALLEHADAFNRSQAPHAVKASRRTSQPVRKRRQAS